MDFLQVNKEGDPLGPLGTLVVDFNWPYAVNNGKWLLYLTEIVTTGTAESHCIPPAEIMNPLNLTVRTMDGLDETEIKVNFNNTYFSV